MDSELLKNGGEPRLTAEAGAPKGDLRGQMTARARTAGRTVATTGGLIAASARRHGLARVTRAVVNASIVARRS